MPSFCSALIPSTPSNVLMTLAIARTAIWYFQFSSKRQKHTWLEMDCLHLIFVTFKPPASWSRASLTVIQSEHLKHSTSQRNRSAKRPNSGCFGISRVDGSALSKGWRSGPKAFRAGLFFFFAHEKPLARRVSTGLINLQHKESSIFWLLAGAIKSVTRNL